MPSANPFAPGFGVELECYLPEGASLPDAANAVTHRLGSPCVVEHYNHGRRSHWKLVTDGSLSDINRGVEFVSPVLRGEEGIAQSEVVCRALSDFGCTVSRRCGLHVHVGVENEPLGTFKNLAKLYSVFEPVIDSIMPVSRRGSSNMYARSMSRTNPQNIDRAATFEQVVFAATNMRPANERRQHKLNLDAFNRHRTVEFRHHSGTLDPVKVRRWTMLCLRMVAASKGDPLPVSAAGPSRNQARRGSKAYQIGEMLLRPEGVTGREICSALNWPSVSIPQQARACGLEFTTQRTGREVRYFAVVAQSAPTVEITIAGLAALIGASDEERQYMTQRAADLAGPVAWAA